MVNSKPQTTLESLKKELEDTVGDSVVYTVVSLDSRHIYMDIDRVGRYHLILNNGLIILDHAQRPKKYTFSNTLVVKTIDGIQTISFYSNDYIPSFGSYITDEPISYEDLEVLCDWIIENFDIKQPHIVADRIGHTLKRRLK